MGYTTDFDGRFEFNKPLDVETFNFLKEFADTRHEGSEQGSEIGLYCQWVPTKDGKGLEWDGGEKFYEYVEWLEYLIKEFLAPKGYVLNGEVTWEGEESGDLGKIIVKNNVVKTKEGKVTYD